MSGFRNALQKMTVQSIEDQGDRVLLFGHSTNYYVIARAGTVLHIGDVIEYEPYGANFGWFERVHQSA